MYETHTEKLRNKFISYMFRMFFTQFGFFLDGVKNIQNMYEKILFRNFSVCFSYIFRMFFVICDFPYHFVSKKKFSEMLGKILNKKGHKIRMDTKFKRKNVRRIARFFRISFRFQISYIFSYFISYKSYFRMFFVYFLYAFHIIF